MAHHKSAIKRIRTNEQRRLRNRDIRSSFRTAIKKWRQLIEEGKLDEAAASFSALESQMRKTTAQGTHKRETISRKVGRLAKELNRAKAEQA